MPTNQGPAVVQVPYRQGIFNTILGAAGTELATAGARAAGGFLADLIHPDPKEEYYAALTSSQKSKNFQDSVSEYQKWLASGDRENNEANRMAWARSRSMDEDEAANFDALASSTDTESKHRMAANHVAEGSLGDIESPYGNPFALPRQAPLAATAPPPAPALTYGDDYSKGDQSGAIQATPPSTEGIAKAAAQQATQSGMGEPAAPSPSAAMEQAQAQEQAQTTQKVDIPSKEPAPVPEPPAPPVKETMQAPPLSPQEKELRRRQGFVALQQIQGNMLKLGEIAQAAQGKFDPSLNAAAAQLVAASEKDLNSLVRQGLQNQGAFPSDINYTRAAWLKSQFELANRPTALDLIRKQPGGEERVAQIIKNAQEYETVAFKMTPQDAKVVIELGNMFPVQAGSQTDAIYANGVEHNRITEQAQKLQHQEFLMTNDLQRRGLDANIQRMAVENQLTYAQAEELNRRGALNEVQIQNYKVQTARAEQELKEFVKTEGLRYEDAQIKNIANQVALVNSEVDQLLKGSTLQMNTAAQLVTKYSVAKQSAIKAVNDWDVKNETIKLAASEMLNKFSDQKVFQQEYGKAGMSPRVETLSRAVFGDNPTQSEKVQALVGVLNPSYGDYLKQRKLLQDSVTGYDSLIAKAAAKADISIDQAMKDYTAALTGPDTGALGQIVNTKNENLSKWLQSNVLDKLRGETVRQIQGMDTESAVDYLRKNPTAVDRLLGTVEAKDGKIEVKQTSLTPGQQVAMFQLARESRGKGIMTIDQMKAIKVTDPKTGRVVTLSDVFGKNLREAYNRYHTFASGSY